MIALTLLKLQKVFKSLSLTIIHDSLQKMDLTYLAKDDIEEMKTRAQKNKLFVYIKIPEVPIRVSYKGERDKNKITDISDFLCFGMDHNFLEATLGI